MPPDWMVSKPPWVTIEMSDVQMPLVSSVSAHTRRDGRSLPSANSRMPWTSECSRNNEWMLKAGISGPASCCMMASPMKWNTERMMDV